MSVLCWLDVQAAPGAQFYFVAALLLLREAVAPLTN
jgi:hypothetical protein